MQPLQPHRLRPVRVRPHKPIPKRIQPPPDKVRPKEGRHQFSIDPVMLQRQRKPVIESRDQEERARLALPELHIQLVITQLRMGLQQPRRLRPRLQHSRPAELAMHLKGQLLVLRPSIKVPLPGGILQAQVVLLANLQPCKRKRDPRAHQRAQQRHERPGNQLQRLDVFRPRQVHHHRAEDQRQSQQRHTHQHIQTARMGGRVSLLLHSRNMPFGWDLWDEHEYKRTPHFADTPHSRLPIRLISRSVRQ